ncbi:nucleotide sugar dehydrogenase [Candidatus Microgenomates bacterium]|nr:nucleotide sugar dehydrogenase [Candidatus Microgenomates bacterium]
MDTSKIDICIVGGCGHVGLPLGLAFAKAGNRVALYDINASVVALVNEAVMPFRENGADELLKAVRASQMLYASTDKKAVRNAKTIILVTGTPVDEHLNPRVNDVINVVNQLIPELQDSQLIVLRSTLFPGTTRKVYQHLVSAGRACDVAFCPERIAEGHAIKELPALPQIVSGCTSSAASRGAALFAQLACNIVELNPEEAELAKLFTNAWRYINFAVSNQFFMIAEAHNIRFHRVYDAMTRGYPRLAGFARPGFAAGPCLFKDTMQLSAFSGNNFFLGHSAMLVNEGLPNFIVGKMKEQIGLSGKVAGILGMAFKGESDDARASLSYKLRKLLQLECARVVCSDEYIADPTFVPMEEVIRQSEVIVIGAPHLRYRNLNLQGKAVFDVWNMIS